MTTRALVKVGLTVLVIGVLAMFPARLGYHWFAPDTVRVSGISGTIWHGTAQDATLNGFYVRDLAWKFRWSDLFGAKLGYAVAGKFAAGFVDGNVAVGIGGAVKLSDLTLAIPLESIRSVPALNGIRGRVSAEFDELRLADGLPTLAVGTVEIAGLTIPLAHRDPIGGFKAEFFTQDSGIVASVEDTAAVIDLAGTVTLAPDGAYELLAQIGPLQSTPAPIREQLRFLGSANDRGQHELRLEGKL